METESTEERLGKLEEKLTRYERRYRLVLTGLGTVVLACAVIWVVLGVAGRARAQNPVEAGKVVRAREFVLEDENGRVRGVLGVTKDVSGMSLYDENGKTRGVLGVTKDGPGLSLGDQNGQFRSVLVVDKDGPGLRLYDENGKARGALVVDKDGSILALLDENGKAGGTLGVTKNGPGLELLDENGKFRSVLDESSMRLFDGSGTVLWSAP